MDRRIFLVVTLIYFLMAPVSWAATPELTQPVSSDNAETQGNSPSVALNPNGMGLPALVLQSWVPREESGEEESCEIDEDAGLWAGVVGRAKNWVNPENCEEPPPEDEGKPAAAPLKDRPLKLYVNETVEEYLTLYLKYNREAFARGLRRSGRYLPMIRRIFAEEGLPLELAYLAAVESNFNPRARSYMRATGLWQFMSHTGRRFGLKIKFPWYDERLDPELATRAAAKFLTYLHDRYGSWELSLAAYNAGEGRVNRAVRKAKAQGKPSDFWNLRLPLETRAYVPAFLAVARLYQSVEQHGFSYVEIEPPQLTDRLEVDFPASLAEIAHRLDLPLPQIVSLNPAWRRGYMPPGFQGNATLRLPVGLRQALVTSFQADPHKEVPWVRHTVEEGETVSHISRAYGVSQQELLSVNPLLTPHRLAIGQELVIPVAARTGQQRRPQLPEEELNVNPGTPAPVETSMHVHEVRQGESLWSISRFYGVSMVQLKKWNAGVNEGLVPRQQLLVFLNQYESKSQGMVEETSPSS